MKEYTYPLDLDWSTDEMVRVTALWADVEAAYEESVGVEQFLKDYQMFKKVVKSIGEEKKLDKAFEKVSGYSLYRAVKQAKKQQTGVLKMGDR